MVATLSRRTGHKCPQEAVSSLPQRKTTLSINSTPRSYMKTTFLSILPHLPGVTHSPRRRRRATRRCLAYNLGLSLAAGRSIPRTRVRAFTADPVGGRRLKKEKEGLESRQRTMRSLREETTK